MIKYEYISIVIPASIDLTMAILKEYGDIGWCMVTMYNGYIFFERRTKVKVG
jgi:hypothetical protein